MIPYLSRHYTLGACHFQLRCSKQHAFLHATIGRAGFLISLWDRRFL